MSKTLRNITIESLACAPVEEQMVEIVERKGIGHPDTICDSMMESISIELSKEYIRKFGFVMHHNIDKCLLVAGQAEHMFGGGRVIEPMLFVIGDRATFEVNGEHVDVEKIAIETSRKWLREKLRFVEPDDVRFQVELKQGSAELTDIFRRGMTGSRAKRKSKRNKGWILGANDTSACVGYAPLTETEKIVLNLEKYLNSSKFKRRYPEMGEDIKVMGVRQGSDLQLTVAGPLIERLVKNENDYFRKKDELLEEMERFVSNSMSDRRDMRYKIFFNTLDVRGRGINGCYLSVTGTSAEDADCGEVGRGN